MANNVTQDWNAVLKSAQAGLASTEQKIAQINQQAQPFQSYVDSAQREANQTKAALDAAIEKYRPRPPFNDILDLEDAARLDPGNAAKQKAYKDALAKFQQQNIIFKQQTDTLQRLYDDSLVKLGRARSDLVDVKEQLGPLLRQADQYQVQINEANKQIGIQAKATTPATNRTVSGTVTPASNKPGNPNQATVTTTTTATANGSTTRTTVTSTSNSTQVTANSTVTTKSSSTKTSITSTSNSTAISTDPSINKLLSTESLVDAQGQPTRSSDPSINKLLTDADKPLVDETGAVKSTDPSIVALVDTPPLVEIDPNKLQDDIANIKVDVPDVTALPGEVFDAQTRATAQDEAQFAAAKDWRVRLALAPGSDYFYNSTDAGIMQPLRDTDGVIFPYTPAISVNYTAKYDESNIVHSNYKVYQYSSSAVEQVSITGDFTCQDTAEAQYLLATIHFFRSMTKMFYGQDKKPRNGTPPPLCYLYGMGGYQFAAHPLAITSFSYSLPQDVDYIKTTGSAAAGPFTPVNKTGSSITNRLEQVGASIGGFKPKAAFSTASNNATVTWVPTRIQLAITCLPIMSRNQVSNNFSLEKYATGNLLLGTQNKGGGFW